LGYYLTVASAFDKDKIKSELLQNRKSPELYLPLLEFYYNNRQPSIFELSKSVGASYQAVKQRLQKLAKLGLLTRGKRGVYVAPHFLEKFSTIEKPIGKVLIVNGGVRRVPRINAINFQLYCGALTKVCKGKYCSVNQIDEHTFIIRKSNQIVGRKMHPLPSGGISIVLSASVFLKTPLHELDYRNKRVSVMFYPAEWGISFRDALGSESVRDGELGEELSKFGEVRKVSRGDPIKADLLFEATGKKLVIEVTEAKLSVKKNRSNIKSMEVQSRLYYGVKSFVNFNVPMFIVLDSCWSSEQWLLNEKEFLEQNSVKLVFTDFKPGWAKKISTSILNEAKIV